jgi:hypothetical protein
MSAPTIEKLRLMTDEQLIKEHDKGVTGVQLGVSYYLDELSRRNNSRQTETMLRYTKWITFMTVVMTIATSINIWLALKLLH